MWRETIDYGGIGSDLSVHVGDSFRRMRGDLRDNSPTSLQEVPMKIRFAVLSVLVLASVVACTQSPTSPERTHRAPSTTVSDNEIVDTTSRGGGFAGSGH